MAGRRVEVLLAVLMGSLLLASVWGWEPINETQLLHFYETGRWLQPQGVISSQDDDYDDYSEEDDPVSEVEVAVIDEGFDPFAENGFRVDARTFVGSPWSSSQSSELNVVCSDTSFQFTLPMGPLSQVKVLGTKDLLSVVEAPSYCGYEVDSVTNTLTIPFTGCNVKIITKCNADGYSVQLLYDEFGQTKVATASCEESKDKMDPGQVPRSSSRPSPRCLLKPTPKPATPSPGTPTTPRPLMTSAPRASTATTRTTPAPTTLAPVPPSPKTPATPSTRTPETPAPRTTAQTLPQFKAQNCVVAKGEQVTCGQLGILSSECESMGCCVDSLTSACYYPLDECTTDQQFVFAIRHDSASIPVDPTKLIVPGYPTCKPVIVNDQVAIYKFKVTECGTHAYVVGETKIFLAEVQTAVKALNLKYGIISRSDPLRFMVECRYSRTGSAQQSLASTGYMVKTPTSNLPSAVVSNGLYGVQLRIAKDKTYSSYLPTNSQPLRLLLGNPVYLELHLKSPKPDAVILVNYCIAYPRSARNALVLVYEGCANPYDPAVSILQVPDLPQNRHQRRFSVNAFQFMDQMTNKYLNEEIYFMCSSEVCRPSEKTCEERCFDGKVP